MLFSRNCPATNYAKLSSIARPVDFEENELILLTAQQSRRFYLLLSGSVCVEFRTRAYSVRIQTLGEPA